MRKWVLVAFLGGIVLGFGLAKWNRREALDAPSQTKFPHQQAMKLLAREDIEFFMLPPDASFERIYQDPVVREVLREPESITLYQRGAGGMTEFGVTFAKQGIALAAHPSTILQKTLSSLNAYGPPTACAFEATVLFCLKRGTDEVRLAVCFGCHELNWRRAGAETRPLSEGEHLPNGPMEAAPLGIGLTPLGAAAIYTACKEAAPQFDVE